MTPTRVQPEGFSWEGASGCRKPESLTQSEACFTHELQDFDEPTSLADNPAKYTRRYILWRRINQSFGSFQEAYSNRSLLHKNRYQPVAIVI